MAQESFDTNLMRFVAAELYFSLGMQAAREFYGKSYFSLGAIEKAAIDKLVIDQVGSNYQALTPALLASQQVSPGMGFQLPPAPQTVEPVKGVPAHTVAPKAKARS